MGARRAVKAWGQQSSPGFRRTAPTDATQIDIKVTLPPTPPPPPPPVRLRHSRSYLLKQQREAEGLAAEASFSGRDESSRSRKALSENAISYLLQQVDDTLDEVEARPSKLASTLDQISTSPVGRMTGQAVRTIAAASVEASRDAVVAAIPVAKWVAQQSLMAASAVLSKEMERQRSSSSATSRAEAAEAAHK